jgi:hypothetical protein
MFLEIDENRADKPEGWSEAIVREFSSPRAAPLGRRLVGAKEQNHCH